MIALRLTVGRASRLTTRRITGLTWRSGWLGRTIDSRDFVVLGTVDRQVWRHGFAHPVSFDAVKAHMADFKANMRVDFTPAVWSPKENAG